MDYTELVALLRENEHNVHMLLSMSDCGRAADAIDTLTAAIAERDERIAALTSSLDNETHGRYSALMLEAADSVAEARHLKIELSEAKRDAERLREVLDDADILRERIRILDAAMAQESKP